MRHTDTDPEKIQFVNFFFTKTSLNNYGDLIRVANHLKTLTEDEFKWKMWYNNLKNHINIDIKLCLIIKILLID